MRERTTKMLNGQNSIDLNSTNIFDIQRTMRAMRRLKPDPVPDKLIAQILEAGVSAPNGGNSQNWRFLVVKDPKIKATIQPYYKRAYYEVQKPRHDAQKPKDPGPALEQHMRNEAAIEYLTDHFHEAPVWIVACAKGADSASASAGASIYPAVQNMLLAARALGLGATLTARHIAFREEVEALLGLPDDVTSFAIIPIGYPVGNFGPTRRAPLSHVVVVDTWDNPWPG
ncbi:MAG: nitroreductase family protein [Pseudomonadota bacterium]|nr:nitroreductase family protein [Pseudomonadota bacterium]